MDTPVYPRFTLSSEIGGYSRIAYRVGSSKSDALLAEAHSRGTTYWVTQHMRPPRFQVKIDPVPCRQPFILYDARRPIYRGRFETLAGAINAIDTKIREEQDDLTFTREMNR